MATSSTSMVLLGAQVEKRELEGPGGSAPTKNEKMKVFGQKTDANWAKINQAYFICT